MNTAQLAQQKPATAREPAKNISWASWASWAAWHPRGAIVIQLGNPPHRAHRLPTFRSSLRTPQPHPTALSKRIQKPNTKS